MKPATRSIHPINDTHSEWSCRAAPRWSVHWMARGRLSLGLITCVLFAVITSVSAKDPAVAAGKPASAKEKRIDDSIHQERDQILSLLAYAVAYLDWQPEEVPRMQRRGYNIASVLADPDGMPVHWARNSITKDQDSTRHAEVKVITEFLEGNRNFDLKGFTIYSTLEPCAMCAGMMVMTSVSRVVYGQSDVDFAGALARLAIDSRSIGGYPPYPRTVISDAATVNVRSELDEAYKRFRSSSKEKMLAKFLTTPEARSEFRVATDLLTSFKVKHSENDQILAASLEMLRTMN